MARGLRNNNPGNLITTGVVYDGEIRPSQDPVFRQFKTMAYGYRAIFMLMAYYLNNNIDTIEKIITTYAPPHENQTGAYINGVCRATGIPKNRKLEKTDGADFINIVSAISHIENGIKAVKTDVMAGYKLQTEITD
ncbi:MAG: structural protein P5 [Prevotellaceae bacterium]|jgi:hypothetical protein|nr:structural protein P5 [Prevotellaceae bacterium]